MERGDGIVIGHRSTGGGITCYLSPPSPCNYLPGREERSLLVDPDLAMNPGLYGALLGHGFRRSGKLVYRHQCDSCSRCVAVRLPVTYFTPRRIQRRIERRWEGVEVIDRGNRFDPAHFALYRRYMTSRHGDGEMAKHDEPDYRAFLMCSWCETRFIEFHLHGRLAAVAVTDRVPDALSAMYTFFDPEFAALSPGVFALLWQIREATRLGLSWLYLGFWIPGCRKMEYKSGYRPLQALTDGRWRRVGPGDPMPLPQEPARPRMP